MKVIVPVIAGLAVGIGFIALLSLNTANSPNPPGSATTKELEEAFKRAENLQEVQLFLEKYPDAPKGFSRSQNQIMYSYTTSKWIDLDGDGNRETFRRLTLSAIFDETGGNGSKPEHIIANRQVASEEDRALRSLETPLCDDDVLEYLRGSEYIS